MALGGDLQLKQETMPLVNKLISFNRGLGALAAEKFASEGSNVAINYMSSKEVADKLASDIASKYGVKTVVIQGVRHSNPMLHEFQDYVV